jgi:alpha-L-rhamnosidase
VAVAASLVVLRSASPSFATSPPAGASIRPVELRCEYLNEPLGVDVPHPRLSWRLAATDEAARGQRQSSYQIHVATADDRLTAGTADVWDSGPVRSDDTQNIECAGPPMRSGQRCCWSVRSADENGTWSPWSLPAHWTTGPLSPADWHAEWIGSPDAVGRKLGDKPVDNAMPDPWFRKSFDLPTTPVRAVVYVASVGYHELYVNGQKVGDAVLAPSATDYAVRARYDTYDVAGLLRPGRNTIGIWLGTGWSIFPAYQTADKPAAPIVLAQAEITLPDGPTVRVGTDGSWRTRASPNMLLGFYDAHGFGGERYDGRLDQPDWSAPTADEAGWGSAVVFHPRLVVSADLTEPNRLFHPIAPVAVAEPRPGVYRVDMGLNYAGWFEMPIVANPGDRVEFQFSEHDDKAMDYGLHSVYVLGPSGGGTFRNRFNYMSGRWVQVTGLRAKPDLSQVKGWVIHTDYRRVGGFQCDQPLLNRIYDAANWTFENVTLGSYLVDCPQRERRGYGDGFAGLRMAVDNYRLDAFLTKWAQDWRDVQEPDGDVPYTAPTVLGGGGPAWSGFCVSLPWETYRRYGDRRVLADSYPEIKRWLASLETRSRSDLLARFGGPWSFLGDWQWPGFRGDRARVEKSKRQMGDTPEALFFNNCYWIYNLQTAAKVADALGDAPAAAGYRHRADEVRSAVHRTFYNAADHSYVNGFPAYLAIALLVDLPPADQRDAVWHRLDHEIMVTRKGHVWAGIIGGGFLFEALLNANRNDLLYSMISKPDYPGWGDQLAHGATNFYEDWDYKGTRLHDSFLYVGGWFIEGLAGIKPSDDGYRHVVIEPWIDQSTGPRRVAAHYDSAYGRIGVAWAKDDRGSVSVDVDVPPGTEASLRLDGTRPGSTTEGGRSVSASPGITLGAGHFHFTAALEGHR